MTVTMCLVCTLRCSTWKCRLEDRDEGDLAREYLVDRQVYTNRLELPADYPHRVTLDWKNGSANPVQENILRRNSLKAYRNQPHETERTIIRRTCNAFIFSILYTDCIVSKGLGADAQVFNNMQVLDNSDL